MNKNQRQRLSQIADELESLLNEIEEIKDEEECKYDNLPDSLRDGEKGDALQEGISSLEDAYSYLSDAIDSVREVE